MRRFEELPLLAVEVDTESERQRGDRVETECVQQLDPQIDVAVRLRPVAIFPMEPVVLVGLRVERQQAMSLGHSHSRCRTDAGHVEIDVPCAAKSATVQRSSPNPMHEEWARSPSGVWIPKSSAK